jgi:hypothetical protein
VEALSVTYGFGYDDARRLLRVARRDSFRSPGGVGHSDINYDEKDGYERGIPFRNDSAETAPAYAVMRITGSSTLTETTPFYMKIGKPNTAFQGLYLINGPDEVESNGYGRGYFHLTENDWNYAQYNTANTPATGESWGVINDSWKLHKYGPGFFILGGPLSGFGFVNVLQYPPAEVLVKNTGSSILAGSSGTVEVWGGTPLSETGSGQTMTGYNRTSIAFGASKFGAAGFMNGHPYIVPFQT